MSDPKRDTLDIDPTLKDRLAVLAERSGSTFVELAESVLREHADAQEKTMAEYAEDEERWQRYLKGGKTISLETMRGRLRDLAGDAARRR